MKRIETIKDLRIEKTRLKLHLKTTELKLEDDIENFRASIKPSNLILNRFGQTIIRKDNGLINFPINAGVELIVNKLLLRNFGFFTKLIVPFFVKNLANNFYGDHKLAIVTWLEEKLTHAIEKGKEKVFGKKISKKGTFY